MEDVFFLLGSLFGAGLATCWWWLLYGDRIGTFRFGRTLEDPSGWEHDGELFVPEYKDQ